MALSQKTIKIWVLNINNFYYILSYLMFNIFFLNKFKIILLLYIYNFKCTKN